jgi:hypothetical protein
MMTVNESRFEAVNARFSLSEIRLAGMDPFTEGLASRLIACCPGNSLPSSALARSRALKAGRTHDARSAAAFAHMGRRHGPTRCSSTRGDDQAKEAASMSRTSPSVAASSAAAQLRLPLDSRRRTMRQTVLTFPELALVAGTRAAAGLGVGFLLADHVPGPARRTIGWTLVLLGLLSTFPLAINVLENRLPASPPD